jgi:hypothetical protein
MITGVCGLRLSQAGFYESPVEPRPVHHWKSTFMQEADWDPDETYDRDPESSLLDRVEGDAERQSGLEGYRAPCGANPWLLLAACLTRPARATVA